jgi:hypothetical protein
MAFCCSTTPPTVKTVALPYPARLHHPADACYLIAAQVKAQCEDPANRFGFPDASAPHGFRPAFNIYAWNEYGEGGILAPCQGQGHMMVDTLAKVLGR